MRESGALYLNRWSGRHERLLLIVDQHDAIMGRVVVTHVSFSKRGNRSHWEILGAASVIAMKKDSVSLQQVPHEMVG